MRSVSLILIVAFIPWSTACKTTKNDSKQPVALEQSQGPAQPPQNEISDLQKKLDETYLKMKLIEEQLKTQEQELAKKQTISPVTDVTKQANDLEQSRKQVEELTARIKQLEEQIFKLQEQLIAKDQRSDTPKNPATGDSSAPSKDPTPPSPTPEMPNAPQPKGDGQTIIEKSKIALRFEHNPHYCLDMAGDGVTNATNIQLYSCGQTSSQWFDLHRLPNGFYKLVRHSYDKGRPNGYQCLHVAWRSQLRGANIETYTCDGGPAQQFQVLDQGQGVIMLRNVYSGKCVDAQGGKAGNGVNVIQWDCLGHPNQKMRVIPNETVTKN